MAYPTGTLWKHIGPDMGRQPIQETSTTQVHPLGTIATAVDVTYGVGRFVYCVGVASTAAGDLCVIDSTAGDTIRAVTGGTSYGACGVAMSANLAGQYGWYQTEGAGPVNAATVLTDAPLFLTSTAGQVDDASTNNALVTGLVSRAATVSGFATCQIDHPNITGASGSGSTVDVTLAAFGSTPAAAGASISGQTLTLQPASAAQPGGITAATYSALTGILKTTLTAEAENAGANTIEVEGQVSDILGVAVAAAKEVRVTSLAVTNNEGDLSIGAGANPGTLVKAVNPATGENVAWITTTAAGHFRFIVTNTVAETNLVTVYVPGGIAAVLKLTFA